MVSVLELVYHVLQYAGVTFASQPTYMAARFQIYLFIYFIY